MRCGGSSALSSGSSGGSGSLSGTASSEETAASGGAAGTKPCRKEGIDSSVSGDSAFTFPASGRSSAGSGEVGISPFMTFTALTPLSGRAPAISSAARIPSRPASEDPPAEGRRSPSFSSARILTSSSGYSISSAGSAVVSGAQRSSAVIPGKSVSSSDVPANPASASDAATNPVSASAVPANPASSSDAPVNPASSSCSGISP